MTLCLIHTLKELVSFISSPDINMLIINFSTFIIIRILIMLIFYTQPAFYKVLGNFACCLFEWIIYTFYRYDIFVTSLTLSYFFFKIDIKLFAILNLIYCLLYCLGHDCSKFNKQFYFTILPTPTPINCTRNINLNIPFFILQQNWSPRVKIISINVLYFIFQVFMSIFCYKPIYEAILNKFINESYDKECLNCYMCEFGGTNVQLEHYLNTFILEFISTIFLCLLVFFVENSCKRISVVSLSCLLRLLVLSFQAALGFEAKYVHFLPVFALSLITRCHQEFGTSKWLVVHMLGCLLGAKFLEVAVYSKLNTPTTNKKTCVEKILDTCRDNCCKLCKERHDLECRGDNDSIHKFIDCENSDDEIKKKKRECDMKKFTRDNEKLDLDKCLRYFMKQNKHNEYESLQKILNKNIEKINLEARSSDMSVLYPHLDKLVRCSNPRCKKRHITPSLPEDYKTYQPSSKYLTTESTSFMPKSYYGNCCHKRNVKTQRSGKNSSTKCCKDSSDTQSRESFNSLNCSTLQKEESEENEKKNLDFYLKQIKGRLSSAERWVSQAKQKLKNNLEESLIDFETICPQ